MQNKDDKVGKLLINNKGKIQIDSQIKSKFWLVRMREKQKSCLITRLVEKYAFVWCKIHF